MVIQLINIEKSFGRGASAFAALKNIDLKISQGEAVAIMGPSGSGKSTLMNIIGCLDRPTAGVYELNGQRVDNLTDKELALVRNRHIGFVFQNFNLLARHTALANVEMPLIYAGVPGRKRRRVAMELLGVVGLKDRMFHKPNELSGGQKQRVAIARALVNHPAILLADEPTGNLDSRSGREIMNLFDTLNSIGVTVITVTHDALVAEYAKRIITIRDGEIVSDGSIPPDGGKNWVPADFRDTVKL